EVDDAFEDEELDINYTDWCSVMLDKFLVNHSLKREPCHC
ncbi:6694_t:CDS:1, partial [Entrophospora sp. SA101]